MVFFSQNRPQITDTEQYPTIVDTRLTWDFEQEGWQTDDIDIEIKRCRFGDFIGLTGELVDPRVLNLRRLHAVRDRPVQSPSNETPSGAGVVQRPKVRHEKRKRFLAWLPFGK